MRRCSGRYGTTEMLLNLDDGARGAFLQLLGAILALAPIGYALAHLLAVVVIARAGGVEREVRDLWLYRWPWTETFLAAARWLSVVATFWWIGRPERTSIRRRVDVLRIAAGLDTLRNHHVDVVSFQPERLLDGGGRRHHERTRRLDACKKPGVRQGPKWKLTTSGLVSSTMVHIASPNGGRSRRRGGSGLIPQASQAWE